MGHLYGDIHKIDSLEVSKNILNLNDNLSVFPLVFENLSEYASSFTDGTEIISEVFSAYYGNVNNDFANKFIEKLK